MQNYFNYFTEIEERFQQRRGSLLMLSTLDWALIETWREAGLPLEAVLRGIDEAFDKHDAKVSRGKGRIRRINGLAWCAQSVLEAAVEQANDIALSPVAEAKDGSESGFEIERVSRYLSENAGLICEAGLSGEAGNAVAEVAARLKALARDLEVKGSSLEELDRTLTVLEDRLHAALMMASSEEELVALREEAARELAPYKGKMQAVQIKQVQQQFVQKKLLEKRKLPRLSLFYMSHE